MVMQRRRMWPAVAAVGGTLGAASWLARDASHAEASLRRCKGNRYWQNETTGEVAAGSILGYIINRMHEVEFDA